MPLPPGPSPLPLFGNLFDIPKTTPWVGYHDMHKKYGMCPPLMSMHRIIDWGRPAR